MGSEPVNYAACLNASDYQGLLTAIGDLDVGTSFCVGTSAGRYAKLTVANEATATRIKFDITVWEKKP